MDWADVAPDFAWDGSLRDIYVLGTTCHDWQIVLDELSTWTPRPDFSMHGQVAEFPDRAESVVSNYGALLVVEIEGMTLYCHFFTPDEIEFDLDPRQVVGPVQQQALVDFVSFLGKATGKVVVLTPENGQEHPIFRYDPDTGAVDWVPPNLAHE